MNKSTKNKILNCIFFSLPFILILIILILIVLSRSPRDNAKVEKVKYTDFISMAKEKKVKEVDLRNGANKITFKDLDEKTFETDNPEKDNFKEFLLESEIKVVNKTPLSQKLLLLTSILLKLGFYLALFSLLYKSTSPAFTKQDRLVRRDTDVTFDNVAGNEEAKEDMGFLVDFLQSPKSYKEIGAKLPKGVVLYGPPGTGKTLMARAVAGEANVPFYNISGSDFVEMYAGLGAKRVRDLFEDAKKNSPSIVFIDEIDAIGTSRGDTGGNGEKDQTINALLSELDGFDGSESVVVMAATNRISDLDPALIRPGRFDRHVSIGLPDLKDREAILKRHAKNKKLSSEISLSDLAKITIGFSGAGLEALMNEAAIIAVTRGSKIIRNEDIDDSYFKIAMKGNKKKEKNKDKEEVELIAYHEAGHTLVTKLLTDNYLHKVTIIPSTSGVGGATFSIPKNKNLITKQEILSNVKVLYAGRAAEEVLKGNKEEITSGASQDIKQATRYIDSYFSELGMSDKFGLLEIEDRKLYMDDAIKLSNELYKETLEFLNKNRNKLDKIANALIEKETIIGEDIDNLIASDC